jgi:hypothetical protein
MDRLSDLVFFNAIFNAEVSDASRISYEKHLRMLLRHTAHSGYTNIWDVIKHPKEIEKYLHSLVLLPKPNGLSLNSVRAIAAVALSTFRHVPEKLWPDSATKKELYKKWNDVLMRFNVEVAEDKERNLFTEREKEAYVPLEEWESKELQLRGRERGSTNHLLVAFHSMIVPVRGGDLAKVEIVSPGDPLADEAYIADEYTPNVLVWGGVDRPSKLLIRDHKTRDSHGVLMREIPPELKKTIAQSLRDEPRAFLFMQDNRRPWSRESFLAWKATALKKIFNKPTSTNAARHAYVNRSASTEESVAQEKQRAAEMGHSVATHRLYRRIRPDDKIHQLFE